MVHVAPFIDSDMIRQQLQRHRYHDRHQALRHDGHFDKVVGALAYLLVALGDHGDNLAAPGLDLLDVAGGLFVGVIRRRDGDGRHLGVDQGDRTVFHFGGRVALCVDVGDLLEFERTFQRRGVVVPASQVDEVVRVGEDFREVGDPVVQAEHLFQHGGQIEQMLGDLARALLVDRTLDTGDHQRQHRKYRYLSREGFGRSHADFGTYVDVRA